MLGAGQFCTNPGLILGLKSEALDTFISSLGKEIAKLEPSCMLHPNIYGNYERGKQTAAAQSGTSPIAKFVTEPQPYFAQQLVLTTEGKNFLENPKLHQEVFGPFSIVVQCENITELISILNHLEGQLTGTILGSVQEVGEHSNVVLPSEVGWDGLFLMVFLPGWKFAPLWYMADLSLLQQIAGLPQWARMQ